MTTQPSTTADNIALVRSAFDALNEGDIDTCLAHLSPDFVINLAGVPTMRGREVWRQGVDVIKRGFPDLHAHIEDIVAAHDRVALRLTFRGTHRGSSWASPPRAATSNTSAMSSIGSSMACSPKNGSALTWPACTASSPLVAARKV
jgi:predicted ester cyclase